MIDDLLTDRTPASDSAFLPAVPQPPESIAEAGVGHTLLEQLSLKLLFAAGTLTLKELASKSKLPMCVAGELLKRLRADQLCEIKGMAGDLPILATTSSGRARALELLAQNRYTGPAPVSLQSYIEQVRKQSVCDFEIHPSDLRRGLAHLALEDVMLDQLGAALNSGAAVFLYGPSGTGKTTIAEALAKVFAFENVWVPHAVEIDDEIIAVYDPHTHSAVDGDDAVYSDQRWVLCKRPTVVVGGELTIEMLELNANPVARFYNAPIQMKANNGILIIDDFGRQRVRPEELLNRWIVPLDRRVDFLTLVGGRKIEVPFEVMVVFATNLDPATLVDAAFLRRIQTKINVGAITERQFHDIFSRVCQNFGMQCDPLVIEELISTIRCDLHEPLRACYPRDIINQVRWAARYKAKDPCLDREAILTAVKAYFVPQSSEISTARM